MKEGPTKEVTVKYNCNGCTYLESGIVYECSEPTVVVRQKQRQAGAFKWAYLGIHAEAHPFCPFVDVSTNTTSTVCREEIKRLIDLIQSNKNET